MGTRASSFLAPRQDDPPRPLLVLMDEDPRTRMLVRRLLRELPCSMVTLKCTGELLRWLEGESVDLRVADHRFAHLSTRRLLGVVKDHGSATLLVLLPLGSATPVTGGRRIRRIGFLIRKPWSPKLLQRMAESLLLGTPLPAPDPPRLLRRPIRPEVASREGPRRRLRIDCTSRIAAEVLGQILRAVKNLPTGAHLTVQVDHLIAVQGSMAGFIKDLSIRVKEARLPVHLQDEGGCLDTLAQALHSRSTLAVQEHPGKNEPQGP